jgi:RNA polymerase sigma factor (sigma-70 family)
MDTSTLFDRDIAKHYQTLDRNETLELILKAKSGSIAAQNKLINSQLKSVIGIARNTLKSHGRDINIHLTEAVNEGSIAFVTAIDKFDTSEDTQFGIYAMRWVNARIQRYAKSLDTIRRPENTYWLKKPDVSNMSEMDAKIAMIEYDEAKKQATHAMVSTSTPIGDESSNTIGDMLESDSGSIDDVIDATFIIDRILNKVSDRDKKILNLMVENNKHYGEVPTNQAIADQLGYSRQYVNIRINELRKKLGNNYEAGKGN